MIILVDITTHKLQLIMYTALYDNAKLLRKKATVHQVTTMLATSKTVLFTGHNHLVTTDADDPSLASAQAIIEVSGHQHRWLAWLLGPGNRTFLEVASMVVTWWIVACLPSEHAYDSLH